MIGFSWLSDALDSALAPACVNDPCCVGYIDLFSSSGHDGPALSESSMHSDMDWNSAGGTQASFQPAAESGLTQYGSTFDAFDMTGGSNVFNSEW